MCDLCDLQWELISGGDLLELLNECHGCMTETAAAFYYTQLLRGVLHMHVMGYCHRWVQGSHAGVTCITCHHSSVNYTSATLFVRRGAAGPQAHACEATQSPRETA
jgi:hypothetical protein